MKKHTKKSSAETIEVPKRELIFKEGSLLDFEYPPGFENDGRKLLEQCPEFSLYELWTGEQELEVAPEIEEAELRAVCRINDSKGQKREGFRSAARRTTAQRVEWAIAIKRLAGLAQRGGDNGTVPLAIRLANTLGQAVLKALDSDDPEKVKDGAGDCGQMIKDAVLAVARSERKIINSAMKLAYPQEAILIWEAKGCFQWNRERPSKSYLRARLEAIGCTCNGDKKWSELFERAALGGLPK